MPYEKSRRAGPAPPPQVKPQPQPQQPAEQRSRIRSTSMSGSGPSPISMQQSGDYENQPTAPTRMRRDSRVLSVTTSSISIGNSGTSTVNLDMTQGSFRSGGGDMDDDSNSNSVSGRPPQQDLVFVDLTLRGQPSFDTLGKSTLREMNGNGGGRGRAGSVVDAAGGMMVVPEPFWGSCMPIYAAYTVKSTIYVFTLAFVLPLVFKEHSTTASSGLLQGSFHASDALSIVYLCYLSFLILLAPAFGALADAASPLSRRRAFHALLGCLCVGPIILLVLLSRFHADNSSSSSSVDNSSLLWTTIIVLGIILILAELINIPLSSEITDMMVATLNDGPTSSSSGLPLATAKSKASLVGLGLATFLIGVPVLVASIALDNGAQAAARYACIGTVIWNLLGTLYVVFIQVCLAPAADTGGGQTPRHHQQQQQQQQQQRGRVAAAADGLGHRFSTNTHTHTHTSPFPGGEEGRMAWGPLALLRILALSPPLFLHFLLIRSFYQAGLRCLTYLGATYILLNMELETQIATNSVILGFVGVLVGTGVTLLFLSAHQTHTHRQEEALCARRASSASQASAVGQVIAAARVDQYGIGFASSSLSSSFSDTHTPAKRPLLIALALLTIIIATCPKQVSPLSLSSSVLSQRIGAIYIIALIAGLCFGFITSYEKGILATMLSPDGLTSSHPHTHIQPATIAGVGVCQFAGISACLGSVLEWFPLVLFGLFNRYNVASAMWSFLLFFGLAFVVISVIMVVERVKEGQENGEVGGERGGEPFPDQPPGRPEKSLTKRMSFFLLRSLPSHLSTIAEGEGSFGATTNTMMSASQVVVSPRSCASLNTVSSLGMPLSDESGGGGLRQVQLQAPPRR